jgi:enamine deaminase RidA (YjgF/YER057c/UK114 family)
MSERDPMQFLQPDGWAPTKGYSNGVAVQPGRMVFVSGQIGWNAEQRLESDAFVPQARQALANVLAVLALAGGRPEHIVRLTWYVVDRDEYVASYPALGRAYRDLMGRHFPAMTAVEVHALVERGARVEIEATAVVPGA